jgi:OOP family OmpA-OmpF porin
MKKLCGLISLLCLVMISHAQVLKRMADRAQRRVESNVGKKVDKSVDDAMDPNKKKKTDTETSDQSGTTSGGTNGTNVTTGTGASGTGSSTLKTYGKFDFIPGEKVIAMEDFSQDAIGDFPDKWNTNATGELVTVENRSGKWLSLSKDGVYMPEFITSLPENFTLEFELMVNPNFDYYSTPFNIYLVNLKNKKEFSNYKKYGSIERDGIEISLHPLDASMKIGRSGMHVWESGTTVMENKIKTAQFHTPNNNYAKVSIWRQKQRIRVYLNEEKIYDLPRAFAEGHTYNSLLFTTYHSKDQDRYLISNLRFAVGLPNTRHKLLNEGKFVTSGILFDVNSATIRGESNGILKEVAAVLKENPTVKVKIVGHTDVDGDDASNLDLSKRRAESVKNSLINEFGIEASRLETDGKGESQPVDKSNTSEGKSNNRRVEFIKL